MSLVLHPQNYFTVVRQIANHLDTATYYVQAVIRNAYTDEIITTLNLTDKGGQRFKKDWLVSADPSGQGFYISIVTSVYTDSGYTTKSENYGDEENTYLIQDRVSQLGRGGGGIDARTLRRIVQEEIGKIEIPEQKDIEIPEQEKFEYQEFKEILNMLNVLRETLMQIPKEKTDISPILAKLNIVIDKIDEKPVTPETDLSAVIQELRDMAKEQELMHSDVGNTLKILENNIKEVSEEMGEKLKNTSFTIQPTTAKMEMEEEKKEEKPFNIKSLAI